MDVAILKPVYRQARLVTFDSDSDVELPRRVGRDLTHVQPGVLRRNTDIVKLAGDFTRGSDVCKIGRKWELCRGCSSRSCLYLTGDIYHGESPVVGVAEGGADAWIARVGGVAHRQDVWGGHSSVPQPGDLTNTPLVCKTSLFYTINVNQI